MTESNWLARRLASIRTSKQRTGDAAEQQALLHLQTQGLQLVQRSFLCKGGEIDLIMRDGKHLVFVEVRKRSSRQFGGAVASVTASKQKRLIHAAQVYLQSIKPLPACRFDLVAFEGEQLIWLKNVISG
ncbi:YraN family protein [Undibacterium sp. Ji22W]|uniref:YraN family protein n=1 Tax=Undibacterium sp. Ji22W TaxID=3413038 RepID=UPI003BF13D05